jgi:hypothetical protein
MCPCTLRSWRRVSVFKLVENNVIKLNKSRYSNALTKDPDAAHAPVAAEQSGITAASTAAGAS